MERKFKLIVMLAFGLIIQTGTECRVADSWAQSLLTNPGMELDTAWTDYGAPPFNIRSSEQKHGGKYSRKFKVDAAHEGIMSAPFKTVGGRHYEWGAWLKPAPVPPDICWTEVAAQLNGQTYIYSLVVLDGEIYGATGNTDGMLFKWNGADAWIKVASKLNGQSQIRSMVVLNGEIYGGTAGGLSGGRLFRWNGIDAWIEVAPRLNSQNEILSMVVLNGEIYAGTSPGGRLFKWNGVNAWTQVASQLNGQRSIHSLVVLDGHILGATGSGGRLFRWNGVNAWTEVAPQLNYQQDILSIVVLNGEIYGGTSPGGRLFKWNGVNAWTELAPQKNSQHIRSLVVFQDKIYAGTGDSGSLFMWNGLDAWFQVAPRLNNQRYIQSLVVFNGQIYGGTGNYGGRLFRWSPGADPTSIRVKLRSSDDSHWIVDELRTGLSCDSWNFISGSFIEDTGGDGHYIVFASATAETGIWYVDDVSLEDHIDDPPIAAPDRYMVCKNTVLFIPPPGVIRNDIDTDSPITVHLAEGPRHGTLVLNANGSFTYEPEQDYLGQDTFVYTATDGTSSSEAKVTITVAAENLITNPGMEMVSGWYNYGSTAINVRSSEEKYRGDYSRRFRTRWSHAGIVSTMFKTVGARNYGWAAWVRPSPVNPWTQVAPKLNSQRGIHSLVALNGEIFGGTSTGGRLFKWNGVDSWIEVAAQLNGQTSISSLVVLKGKVYAGTSPGGRLFKWNNADSWIQVAGQLNGQTIINSLVVLNNEIYGGTGPGGRLFKWNGIDAWVEVAPQQNGQTDISSLVVFNGEIYAGTSPGGRLFQWNGTDAWTEVAPQLNAQPQIHSLVVFDGDIYGSTRAGSLFKWDGEDSWIEVAPRRGYDDPSLVVANGSIYGGTYPDGKLLKWNGVNAWTPVGENSLAQSRVRSMVVLNDEIYGGTEPDGMLFRASPDDEAGRVRVKIRSGGANSGWVVDELKSDLSPDTWNLVSGEYTEGEDTGGNGAYIVFESDTISDGIWFVDDVSVFDPVNDSPIACDDSYSLAQDSILRIARPGVLRNDVDPDSTLTASLAENVRHGSLVLNSDGSFTYTPYPGYFGPDSFQYTAADDSNSSQATVSITVWDKQAPTILQTSLMEGQVIATPGSDLLATFTDNAGIASVRLYDQAGNDVSSQAVITTSSLELDLSSFADGSYRYTLLLEDISGNTTTQAFTFTINYVDDPPVAVADSYMVLKNNVLSIASPGVLANDSDDGSITASLVQDVQHGTLVLKSNGTFTYTPSKDYFGFDGFEYTATDGANSSNAVVSIAVLRESLLPNPGMEENFGWANYGTPTVNMQSSDQKCNGVYSRKLSVNAAHEGIQSATFTTLGGRDYEWSARIKQEIPWVQVAPTISYQNFIYSLVVHNGGIYGGTSPGGKLLRWNGFNAWTEVAPQLNSQTSITSLVVFNGEIYGGTSPGGRLFKWNGLNAWTEVAPQLYSETSIYSLQVLNGKIYAGTGPSGRLLRWNGVDAWEQVAPQVNSSVRALIIHNGELYGGTTGGTLLKWNGVDAWIQVSHKSAYHSIYSLVEHNGEIYAGTYPGWLLRWNDVNGWTEVVRNLNNPTCIYSLLVLNGEIYGAITTWGKLVKWNGADAWIEVAPRLNWEENHIVSLVAIKDKIYAGTSRAGGLFRWDSAAAAPYSTRAKIRGGDDSLWVLDDVYADLSPFSWSYIGGTFKDMVGGARASIVLESDTAASGTWYVDDVLVHDRVNDPPMAMGDSYTVAGDSVLSVSSTGVLANDTDPDSILTASLVRNVQHGTLVFHSGGSFTYTPDQGYVGLDDFQYMVSDEEGSSEATVTIHVVVPPIVTLSANPAVIPKGGGSTLSWSSQHADFVSISPDIGPVAASGAMPAIPASTTTYEITATGPGGTRTAQAVVTVDVQGPTIVSAYPGNGQSISSEAESFLATFSDASGTRSIRLYDTIGREVTSDAVITADTIELPLEGLTEGSYLLTLALEDNLGNSSSFEFPFVVDNTTPVTIASPSGANMSGARTVQLVCSEPSTIYYSVDGYPPFEGAANTTAAPFTSEPISIPVTRSTRLQFFAIDRAGNREMTKSEFYLFGLLPAAVENLSAVYNASLGRVELNWAPAGEEIETYRTYRCTNPFDLAILEESRMGGYPAPNRLRIQDDIPGDRTAHSDGSCLSGVTYWYAVAVVDSTGAEGIPSRAASVYIEPQGWPQSKSEAIERGFAWLECTQVNHGYWGKSEQTRVLATSEALNAFRAAGRDSAGIRQGAMWLRSQPDDNNDYLSRKIMALYRFGQNTDQFLNRLVSRCSSGCGTSKHYQPDPIDTALAGLAANCGSDVLCSFYNGLYMHLKYSMFNQGDRRYGWVRNKDTSIFVSAMVYRAIGSPPEEYQWIIDSRHEDGSYGNGLIDSAAVLSWLALPANAREDLTNYLLGRQSLNGSWSSDPYLTALCLAALLRQPDSDFPRLKCRQESQGMDEFHFSGDDYLHFDLPNNWSLGHSDFSISLEVKLEDHGERYHPFCVNGQWGWKFIYDKAYDVIWFNCQITDPNFYFCVGGLNQVLFDGSYHQVRLTRSGSEFGIWVDGIHKGSHTSSLEITDDPASGLYLGRAYMDYTKWYHAKGFMKNFQIIQEGAIVFP